jgi:hypothetical protein
MCGVHSVWEGGCVLTCGVHDVRAVCTVWMCGVHAPPLLGNTVAVFAQDMCHSEDSHNLPERFIKDRRGRERFRAEGNPGPGGPAGCAGTTCCREPGNSAGWVQPPPTLPPPLLEAHSTLQLLSPEAFDIYPSQIIKE